LLGSATWWCVLAFGAAGLRSRLKPGVIRAVSVFSGLVILVLGVGAVISALMG